jgi:hypothetical protein
MQSIRELGFMELDRIMSSYQVILDISVSELPIDDMAFFPNILQGRNSATCYRRLLETAGLSTEDSKRSRGGHKEQLPAGPDTGDQLQRAEGHSASMPEPRAEGARQGAQAGGHRRVAVRRRTRDEPCRRAPLPGPAHPDQRRAAAEQLPAVAVGVLGALLHGHAVARLRGGRLPGGPGLLPEQGEAVRCQEIVAQGQEGMRKACLNGHSLAGKRWSVEHDGFGAHGVRMVRLCLLRLTNGAWVFCRMSIKMLIEDYTVEGELEVSLGDVRCPVHRSGEETVVETIKIKLHLGS